MAAAEREQRLEALRRQWEGEPYHRLLGIAIEELREGYARLRLPFRAEHRNRDGLVHGGAISSLVDMAAVIALDSALDYSDPDLLGHSSIELNVSFLAAARAASVAEGSLLRLGRTIAVCDIDVRDEAGTALAKGRVTFMVFRRPPSAEGRGH